jgi:hypothetical protein
MRRAWLLAAGLAACGGDDRPGTVTVAWRTGGLSCAQAGIHEVRAELYGYGDNDPAATDHAPCERNELELVGVPPGGYTLYLKGFAGNGCWTHEARQDLHVAAGKHRELAPLPLLRRRRAVDVRWPFAAGLDCAGIGAEQVEVTVAVGDEYRLDEVYLCAGGHHRIDGVPPGPMAVTVVALDGDGQPAARGVARFGPEVFDAVPCPDAVVEAAVTLAPCQTAECP